MFLESAPPVWHPPRQLPGQPVLASENRRFLETSESASDSEQMASGTSARSPRYEGLRPRSWPRDSAAPEHQLPIASPNVEQSELTNCTAGTLVEQLGGRSFPKRRPSVPEFYEATGCCRPTSLRHGRLGWDLRGVAGRRCATRPQAHCDPTPRSRAQGLNPSPSWVPTSSREAGQTVAHGSR